MRIAISNIAWDVSEDDDVAALLARFGVDAIDVAPTKYFPDPFVATKSEIAEVRDAWARRGVEITGMQSLLFGAAHLNIFGAAEICVATRRRLEAVIRIGEGLSATRLVFGSFKNRDRSRLSDEAALQSAASFFRSVGDVARDHGVVICLEPVPAEYGANFMTTTAEAAHVVAVTDHPAIRLHLDTGTMAVNGENPRDVIRKHAHLVGHVHASEPNLAPVGDDGADHRAVARALAQFLPDQVVSIEMLAPTQESRFASIERALARAVHDYRDCGWAAA